MGVRVTPPLPPSNVSGMVWTGLMNEARKPDPGSTTQRATAAAARFAALLDPDFDFDFDLDFLDDDDLSHNPGPTALEADAHGNPQYRQIAGEQVPVPAGEQAIDRLLAVSEHAATRTAAAMAEQLAGIDATLRQACRTPDVFLGPHHSQRPKQEAEFARRAAVCELAARLHVSENTISSYAATADTLRSHLPATWTAFRDGTISFGKVQIIADEAATLAGQISADAMAELDATLLAAAGRLTPAKLRQKARLLHERLHPEAATDRHAKARAHRGAWLEADLDGMAWLTAHLPADTAHRAYARIDAHARHLADLPEETRTLTQLRADVAGDILTGDGTPNEVRTVVNLTVPVLTLLDNEQNEQDQDREPQPAQPVLNLTPAGAPPRIDPAILEGYGPIDPDTARRLTGTATSIYRILVDPVNGAVITVDRKKYRPPADLKRLVTTRFATCSFPGCNRPAQNCDIDHTDPWELGGTTAVTNLAPLCRHHHRVKHNTGWQMKRTPTTGTITWISPRGTTHDTDPPPF